MFLRYLTLFDVPGMICFPSALHPDFPYPQLALTKDKSYTQI